MPEWIDPDQTGFVPGRDNGLKTVLMLRKGEKNVNPPVLILSIDIEKALDRGFIMDTLQHLGLGPKNHAFGSKICIADPRDG